jgi:hypothetical protein
MTLFEELLFLLVNYLDQSCEARPLGGARHFTDTTFCGILVYRIIRESSIVPASISALENTPDEFVREVSPDAITFYIDELSGIYLPEAFKEAHAGRFDVDYWKPEARLRGKFGRFALKHIEEAGDEEPLDGILVMGTTIGLSGLDRYGDMVSLRHFAFNEKIREILDERDLLGRLIDVKPADYGATTIKLGDSGVAEALSVDGSSGDYGRATAEGRQETCAMFAQLLGNEIQVINVDPEPRPSQRIVD